MTRNLSTLFSYKYGGENDESYYPKGKKERKQKRSIVEINKSKPG